MKSLKKKMTFFCNNNVQAYMLSKYEIECAYVKRIEYRGNWKDFFKTLIEFQWEERDSRGEENCKEENIHITQLIQSTHFPFSRKTKKF